MGGRRHKEPRWVYAERDGAHVVVTFPHQSGAFNCEDDLSAMYAQGIIEGLAKRAAAAEGRSHEGFALAIAVRDTTIRELEQRCAGLEVAGRELKATLAAATGSMIPSAASEEDVQRDVPDMAGAPAGAEVAQSPLWILCKSSGCNATWCTKHECHVFDCFCPSAKKLGFDPFSQGGRVT